jgi:hypothetical protein
MKIDGHDTAESEDFAWWINITGVRRRQNAGERTLSVAVALRAQYLSEMLIRLTALLTVALSGCGFQSDGSAPDAAPTLSTTEQAVSCGYSKYICDPDSPWSNWECEQVCAGSAHCIEYATQELVWCAAHPDHLYNPYKLCGPDGYPMWRTWCVPGPVP